MWPLCGGDPIVVDPTHPNRTDEWGTRLRLVSGRIAKMFRDKTLTSRCGRRRSTKCKTTDTPAHAHRFPYTLPRMANPRS